MASSQLRSSSRDLQPAERSFDGFHHKSRIRTLSNTVSHHTALALRPYSLPRCPSSSNATEVSTSTTLEQFEGRSRTRRWARRVEEYALYMRTGGWNVPWQHNLSGCCCCSSVWNADCSTCGHSWLFKPLTSRFAGVSLVPIPNVTSLASTWQHTLTKTESRTLLEIVSDC